MSHKVDIRLEEVLARDNLRAAWAAVKANAGAAGVDGKGIEETERHLREHWPVMRERLLNGAYQPAAVRGVEIAKPGGGKRQLGIPTVQDRLIQQALHHVLSAAFDPDMSEHSWGFRPGRSAHDAVGAARGYVAEGKEWVVDIDLASFFDQVNHDRLMHLLGQRISDKRIMKLIGRYLRAPMDEGDGRHLRRSRGTPQGGPLSPLLANLYLDVLDRELEQRGLSFVRYADDIAVFVASERAAERVLERLRRWLHTHLDLEVNAAKSGARRTEQTALLGFRIHPGGEVSLAPKAIERLKDRVREIWDARQSLTSEQLREQWQGYINGWWNYFSYANWRRAIHALSGWIRRHMRKCFWLRWHDRHGRRQALYRLGVNGRRLGVAGCRRGAWFMARHVVIQEALKTATLTRHGFVLPWTLAG